ncbi:15971_t:CDS:1, partial [Racocetra persica]
NKDGGTLEFTYTATNDNLITGETFERVIYEKFKNLSMFKICFPCTPYLLSGGELLFSNGNYDSWTIRIENMKLEGGTKIETMIEEDYEYVQSKPDINRPFQVARVEKWNLTGDGGYD